MVVSVDFSKLQHFSHHQQHDQATVGVYGEIAHRSDIVGGRSLVVTTVSALATVAS